jgi:hypothetical protein
MEFFGGATAENWIEIRHWRTIVNHDSIAAFEMENLASECEIREKVRG